jgi:hypothetical protein
MLDVPFQLTFRLTFFQKYDSRCCGKHIFAIRILALPIKHMLFLHPKRLQKGSRLAFLLALVALLTVQLAIFPLLELLKKGLWPDSRAHFVPKARQQRRLHASHLHFYESCMPSIVFFAFFTVSYTLFLSKLHIFCKKCSPPSVGSTISKAAAMRNHETSAIQALQIIEAARFLPHLLHPDSLRKQ